MNIKNKTILITGGSSGIGLEFVRQLNQMGVNLIITGRNEEKLAEVKAIYPNVKTIVNDISQNKDILGLYQLIIQEHTAIDMIINNAGIMHKFSLQQEDLTLEELVSEIEVNLNGIIKLNHLLIPHLKTKKEAAIVNISSGLAFVPFLASPIYSVAKAGLHVYSKLLRLELKDTSVKVFEIAPPTTDTTLINKFKDPKSKLNIMSTTNLVGQALKAIENNKYELKPGGAGFLYWLGRIAPGFAMKMVNGTRN